MNYFRRSGQKLKIENSESSFSVDDDFAKEEYTPSTISMPSQINFENMKKMKNPYVIIIGISDYTGIDSTGKEDLKATINDTKRLKKLFKKKYRYKNVICIQDFIDSHQKHKINEKNLEEFLEKQRDNINKLFEGKNSISPDGLLFFFSGHGREKGVKLGNGDTFTYSDIQHIFNNKNCKHLINKPKCYFFDCCRGIVKIKAVNFNSKTLTNNENDSKNNELENTNKYNDIMIIFSTVNGTRAYDNKKNGFLIMSLYSVYKKLSFMKSNSLHDASLKIKKLVQYHSKSSQTCECVNRLDYDVKLLPNNSSNYIENDEKQSEIQHNTRRFPRLKRNINSFNFHYYSQLNKNKVIGKNIKSPPRPSPPLYQNQYMLVTPNYYQTYKTYNPNNYQLILEQPLYYKHYLSQQQRLYEQQQKYYRQHELYLNENRDVVSDVVNKPSSKFDSRSKSGNENIGSHLQLIDTKETAKSKLSTKFLKKALKKEELFDDYSDEMINDIVNVMYQIECEKDDIIIKQGEYGDAYFVVESGKFHVLHNELGGLPDKIIGEVTPGDCFGEGSLIYSIPRVATIKAVEYSVVWALDATKFIQIQNKVSEKATFLKTVAFFNRYSSDYLSKLAYATTARTYKVGEEIVTQGDKAKAFFVIRRGQAEVVITDTDTKEKKIVKELKDRECFGERGIFLSTRRAATVTAKTACKCYVILAQDFRNFLDSSDDNGVIESVVREYDRINFEKGIKTKFVNQIKTKLNDFKNIGILGIGTFGRVSLVEDPNTGKTYSLKQVRKNKVIKTGQEEHIRNERAVLGILNSDFCCRLFATYQDKLHVYFLTEALLGGNLYNIRFSEKKALFYTVCVVLAFDHLHSKSIIYRNLNTKNVLISKNGYIKLTDFRYSKRRDNSCTLCGTPEYSPPEMIQNYPQGFGVDWWQLGIFIYELVIGHTPFVDENNIKIYNKILTAKIKFPNNQKFTPEFIDLIHKLLERNQYKRLGAGIKGSEKVKSHPRFKGLNWDLLLKQEIKAPYIPEIENERDLSNFDDINESLLDDPKGDIYGWCQDF